MTAPNSTSEDQKPRRIEVSLMQVSAAALAAVTAAVVGSTLGVAGTLVGAASASMILNVGTAVYRASLEQSRRKIRSLAQRAGSRPVPRDASEAGSSDSAPSAQTGDEQPTDTTEPGVEPDAESGTEPEPSAKSGSRRFSRLRWGAVAVGTLGSFIVAMMLITGFEWASGEPLSGDGHGTTLGRVVDAPPPQPAEDAPVSETPTETSDPVEPTETTDPADEESVEQDPEDAVETTPTEIVPTSPVIPLVPGVDE